MKRIMTATLFALSLAALPAAAQDVQPEDTRQHSAPKVDDPTQKTWQFWVKGQGQLIENFFQATEGQPEEDVTGVFGEIGASVKVTGPVRAYAAGNLLRYDHELGDSTGLRLGLRSDGQPHSFDVYVEQLSDRPSFDVGDEYDRANIRSLVGEWGWRFHDDWQLSADGELQRQEFKITANRDNDYKSAGAALRWRRMRLFSPEVGFRVGERDVDDPTQSYDQNEAYLQIRSSPVSKLYLSLRFRQRLRDYSTGAVANSNYGREDKRRQVALSAAYAFTPSLSFDVYAAREKVDVNREARDFDTTFWMGGLTWKF